MLVIPAGGAAIAMAAPPAATPFHSPRNLSNLTAPVAGVYYTCAPGSFPFHLGIIIMRRGAFGVTFVLLVFLLAGCVNSAPALNAQKTADEQTAKERIAQEQAARVPEQLPVEQKMRE